MCRSVVFSRIKHAPQSDVESQIWAAHSRLNTLFRTKVAKVSFAASTATARNCALTRGQLRRVKDAAVESRLLLKKYLDFLKTSQIYYRAYILQLDEQFGGIEELREIARKWAPEGMIHTTFFGRMGRQTQSDSGYLGVLCRSVGVSSQQKEYVLQSCFQCLIHLGDLSRYRETEINQGQRNWAPAVGYYSLAAELCPTVGIAHNQLAVVALTEKNHLRAIYHLYRSLSLEEPHPSAQDNLELEFKKIINAQKKRAVGLAPNGNGANASLISWFVLLHSKCYRGELYSERDELQKEVLSQLISAIRERTLDSKLQMMFLINMAAEYVAASKLRSMSTHLRYSSIAQRLTVSLKMGYSRQQTLPPFTGTLCSTSRRSRLSLNFLTNSWSKPNATMSLWQTRARRMTYRVASA